MLHQFRKGVAVLAAIMAYAGAAHAACTQPGVVNQVGLFVQMPPIGVSANALPASDAANAATPKSWTYHEDARNAVPVSFGAGTAFLNTFQEIAKQGNACVTIDWHARAITLTNAALPAFDTALLQEPEKKAKPAAPKPARTQPIKSPPPEPAHTVIVQTAPAPLPTVPDTTPIAPLPAAVAANVDSSTLAYELRTGETLRGALTRWSHDTGWTLVWDTDVDYKIEAGTVFPTGTTLKGAVKETMHAFWDRTRWLRATTYRNNVIVVTGSNL